LAMISFRAGQAEQAFLENGIAAIPQGEGKAKTALAVSDAKQAILTPAISAAAGVIVRKVVPTITVGRVILAHGAPLTFGKIRPPSLPVFLPRGILLQTLRFSAGGCPDLLFS